MKLLLRKSITKLGIVGDVVNVAPGYARNYLLPQGLAMAPTDTNMRTLVEARRQAEEERAAQQAQLKALAERIDGMEVTIRAKANEAGHLYGSVGAREIVAALAEEQYYVEPEQVVLVDPIRELDNLNVDIKLGPDLNSTIKVWVVREKSDEDGEDGEGEEGMDATEESDTAQSATGTEAANDDDRRSE